MLKVSFYSRPNFRGMHKDSLPTHTMSNIIYMFSCYCGSKYVGKTSQTLKKRSKQHIPACLVAYKEAHDNNTITAFKETKKWQSAVNSTSGSNIAKHLFDNQDCLTNMNFDRFKVVARGRNKFHLDVLESVFISTVRPEICKQTEFCYKILLFQIVRRGVR